jgi:hypothetical protein
MRKLFLIILLAVFLFGCRTSSHVSTVLGRLYPEYLKCDDCTDNENVIKASDRIMRNFLKRDLENYKLLVHEQDDCIALIYQLKDTRITIETSDEVFLDGWHDAIIIISKIDCKIIDIKRI